MPPVFFRQLPFLIIDRLNMVGSVDDEFSILEKIACRKKCS